MPKPIDAQQLTVQEVCENLNTMTKLDRDNLAALVRICLDTGVPLPAPRTRSDEARAFLATAQAILAINCALLSD